MSETDDNSEKRPRCGTLNLNQYNLLLNYIKTGVCPYRGHVLQVGLYDEGSRGKYGGLYRVKEWAKRMGLDATGSQLVFKKNGKLIVPEERFEEVVRSIHCNPTNTNKHLNFQDTLAKLQESYTVGRRQFGISEDVIRHVIRTCREGPCSRKGKRKLIQPEQTQSDVDSKRVKHLSPTVDNSQSQPSENAQASSNLTQYTAVPYAIVGQTPTGFICSPLANCFTKFKGQVCIMEPFLVPKGSSFLPQNIVFPTPSIQGKQLCETINPELCNKQQTGESIASYSEEHDTNAPNEEPQSITKEAVQNLPRNKNLATFTAVEEETSLNDKQETEQINFAGSDSSNDSVVNKFKPTLAYQNQDKGACTEMTTEQSTNPYICILPLDDKSQTPIIKNSEDSKCPISSLESTGCEINLDLVTSKNNFSNGDTSGLSGDKLTTDKTDLLQLLNTNKSTGKHCSLVGREYHLDELNKGIDEAQLQKDLKELYELQPFPNPLIWNFFHDLQKASSPYERLRIMVQDMKMEIKRCLMNDMAAIDRFKRKLYFLTCQVRKLKTFTGKYKESEREKQTQEEDVAD
ncbi:hypothetical protein CHS0354_024688 [Potamilus streckersoni]|uniref:Uncharacterized protein n=1 Tax=Potamilus streckersoni TaxID=2493646 RepID=A0AAE0RX04_9BIVA|nr:hypothetical protein CHS0354_024688 [Potamilus streckersoni]